MNTNAILTILGMAIAILATIIIHKAAQPPTTKK